VDSAYILDSYALLAHYEDEEGGVARSRIGRTEPNAARRNNNIPG